MDPKQLTLITALRHSLHSCAELSGEERETARVLKAFLAEHTTLELRDIGSGRGFYAAHREPGAAEGILLRADDDALAVPGGAAHLCGHDGHAAALCGVALALEGVTLGKDVFLLFQPAEETGAGAAPCCAIFDRERVTAVYGCHNLPGFPFGRVLTRTGTFACASRGVTLRFRGAATHAAYPELGRNPAPAVGALLTRLDDLADASRYTGMTLCTVIGARMGEKAFGAAAADAEVWLTLRAEHNADLERLRNAVMTEAEALAAAHGLGFGAEEQDVFPATENDEACARHVMAVCDALPLAVPMRWSEDFGHYLLHRPGAFFGIGAGEEHPGLHTEHYEYPDALLEPTCGAFLRIINA